MEFFHFRIKNLGFRMNHIIKHNDDDIYMAFFMTVGNKFCNQVVQASSILKMADRH